MVVGKSWMLRMNYVVRIVIIPIVGTDTESQSVYMIAQDPGVSKGRNSLLLWTLKLSLLSLLQFFSRRPLMLLEKKKKKNRGQVKQKKWLQISTYGRARRAPFIPVEEYN